MIEAKSSASQVAVSRSKSKAWWYSSGRRYNGRRAACDPRLGDHHPVVVVLVEHAPPTPHDRVDLVAVVVRQRLGLPPAVVGRRTGVGVAGRLRETVGDVDPEACSATIEPEPHHGLELVGDLGMLPVDVGLALVEQVEVPLPVGHAGPRRTAEHRLPVVGWQLTVVAASVEEVVAGALVGSRRRGERRPEPHVIPRGVVRDEVDEHAYAVRSLPRR